MKTHQTVTLVDRTFFDEANAVYSVQTRRSGIVYMRVARSNYLNDERWVVVVNADRLKALWRLAYGPQWLGHLHRLTGSWRYFHSVRRQWLPHLPLSAWCQDYKMHHANAGFARGRANPVPLALLGLAGNSGKLGVDFINGITRSLWLWTNGAEAFPVECRTASADTIWRLAGVDWAVPTTVQELLGDLSWGDWVRRKATFSAGDGE